MPKYNYKDDAMTAFMKGKISAQELDKISKNQFKTSVATKQELQNFLKSGYMKELMANTYGLKVPAMEKKVKELMRFAESMQFEGMFSTIDQIRQDSKDVRDFVKNVFADKDFKKMKNDKEFIKYLKSIYEGTTTNEAAPKMKKNPNVKSIQNVFSQTLNLKKGGMQSRYMREFESARKRALKALRDMEKFSKIGV